MTTPATRRASDPVPSSTRITAQVLARHPGATQTPAPHTTAELNALIDLLRAFGATRIAVGHGRHDASVASAEALGRSWTDQGGAVMATVSWPVTAASWLRPARRLVEIHPDAWVIVDNPAGCAQLAARLTNHPDWAPARTFGTASLDNPDLTELTGFDVLTGMTGATAAGGTWRIGRGLLIRNEAIEISQ